METSFNLLPGTRFASQIPIADNGFRPTYRYLYHVVTSTQCSLTVICSTLFDGDVKVKGNELLDSLLSEPTIGPIFAAVASPRIYTLKKDENGHNYFIHGTQHIFLNGPNAVTYIRKKGATLKRKTFD